MVEGLLSGKEIPGLRNKYRLQNSSDLDYGNRWEEYDTAENYLVSKSFIKDLFEHKTTCKNCNFLLKFEEVGHGSATTITAKCTNEFCESDSTMSNLPRKLGRFYCINLGICYESLVQDTGYQGFLNNCLTLKLPAFCKDSFYNHANYLYELMKTFYETNITKTIDEIKSFFF